MCGTPNIKDCSTAFLRQWLEGRGYRGFRVQQIHHWLYKKWCGSFEDMRNLPRPLQIDLAGNFQCSACEVQEELQAPDGTTKFLFRLHDGQAIETVLIPAKQRQTVCLSTQVGCPVRCSFCATGRSGFVRNLTAAEIIDQVIMCCRKLGNRVSNIVVMGMGEPLLNYENTVTALDSLTDNDHLGIGARRITVSTSGIPEGIRRLAAHGKQWGLALSLHAVSDEKRARLIPDPLRFPLSQIFEACREYRDKTGRVVTLEYTLIAGINDSDEDARRLAGITKNLGAKINLIGLNATGAGFDSPTTAGCAEFARHLQTEGAKVMVRHSRGDQIQAACGQLRNRSS